MKKIITLIIALLLVVSMIGCGAKGGVSGSKKLVCSLTQDNGSTVITIGYSQDTIKAYEVVAEMESEPATTDMMIGIFEGVLEEFKAIKGITAEIKASEDKTRIIMTIAADYTKLDKKALTEYAEKMGSSAGYADIFGSQTSLSATQAELESEGYTCN